MCWTTIYERRFIYTLINTLDINSSHPSAAYMRQWTGSALVQVMACRLFGAKLLPEPMLAYCQLDSWEQISVKLEWEFFHFHSRKCIGNCRLPKWRPLCPGGNELNVTKLLTCKKKNVVWNVLEVVHSTLFLECRMIFVYWSPGNEMQNQLFIPNNSYAKMI